MEAAMPRIDDGYISRWVFLSPRCRKSIAISEFSSSFASISSMTPIWTISLQFSWPPSILLIISGAKIGRPFSQIMRARSTRPELVEMNILFIPPSFMAGKYAIPAWGCICPSRRNFLKNLASASPSFTNPMNLPSTKALQPSNLIFSSASLNGFTPRSYSFATT